ncbi:hypothetical protein BGZ80_011333 [Entomortierella chlamydospora]|uniref:Uncharacterized protein n=1 Tax=Entomortierella chlamydospora TaxID=101097 RepID=A0A9P6N4C6_9FUNG|nr:hypothetical protein BGZ79_005505 [Entomortierella chlamydospora]KAG0024665.1 hypothetical protein BGZ80_011333 [Entomortierella chlamydospora]
MTNTLKHRLAQALTLSTHTNSIIVIFSCLSWITPIVRADLTCQSPTGSYNLGDTVTLLWSDNGQYPQVGDVYSASASVYCSSNTALLLQLGSVVNGQPWIIPNNILTSCPGNQIYIEYSGEMYNLLHLLHITTYKLDCRDVYLPSPTTTSISTTTLPSPTQQQTSSTLNPPSTTTTAPIVVTSISIVSIVPTSSGSTQQQQQPSGAGSGSGSGSGPGRGSAEPGSNASPTQSSSPNQPGSNTTTNEPGPNTLVAVLGALAGVLLVALIIVGMIMARKRMTKKRLLADGRIGKAGFAGAAGAVGREGRNGDSEGPWDQIEYHPGGFAEGLEFVPLQHQSEMRDYIRHSHASSQPSSIMNMPMRPVSGYRGDFGYSNRRNFVRNQSYISQAPTLKYLDEYGHEQDVHSVAHFPSEDRHGEPVFATSQPTNQEYHDRIRSTESDEISPYPIFPIPSVNSTRQHSGLIDTGTILEESDPPFEMIQVHPSSLPLHAPVDQLDEHDQEGELHEK